jgi:hypothetical protein
VLVLGAIVAAVFGFKGLSFETFLGCIIGGLIWAVSCWFAFVGVSKIGMAKAFGIWAPMNVIVGIIRGIVLRGEFIHTRTQMNFIPLTPNKYRDKGSNRIFEKAKLFVVIGITKAYQFLFRTFLNNCFGYFFLISSTK